MEIRMMEKRIVHIEDKKEVKPQKKRKRKPVVKKVFRRKIEKREWFDATPPNDMGSYD